MIMRFKKPSIWWKLKIAILVIILCGLSLTATSNIKRVLNVDTWWHSVILDPGHGGTDPGVISSNGIKEKDVVLAISNRIKEKLEVCGIKVYLTRSNDEFASLEKRTNFYKEAKADLFVSLHLNGSSNTSAEGITVFVAPYSEESTRNFAVSLGSEIRHKTNLKWNDYRRAPMAVFNNNPVPAIMLELGYLSNDKDLEKLIINQSNK